MTPGTPLAALTRTQPNLSSFIIFFNGNFLPYIGFLFVQVRGRIKSGKGMGGDPYINIRPDRIEIVVSKREGALENSLPDMRSRWEQWSGC